MNKYNTWTIDFWGALIMSALVENIWISLLFTTAAIFSGWMAVKDELE